jgi:hypothetical protein
MDYAEWVSRKYGLGKTYSNVDEAFKTADYATGLWKCETELDRFKRGNGLPAMLGFIAIFGLFIYIAYVFK